jgi:hypothetical protein
MILSEYQRRWDEIRLYYFIKDVFQMRKDTMDVVTAAEAICNLGDAKLSVIRQVITKILNDPYFIPYKTEIIILGHIQGVSDAKIAEIMGITRQGVYKHIKKNAEEYEPYPKCSIDESYEINKFLTTLNKLKNIGINV